MTHQQKNAIANVLITNYFEKNQDLVCQGDAASSYYIIKKGTVSVILDGKVINKMEAGDTFGEQALYENSVRGCTCRADSEEVNTTTSSRDVSSPISHLLGYLPGTGPSYITRNFGR